MLLQHLTKGAAYKAYKRSCPWIETISAHDTQGATATAAALGMTKLQYLSTRSPIEKAILSRFGKQLVIVPDSPLQAMMREIGRAIFDEIDDLFHNVPHALENAPKPFDCGGARLWDLRDVDIQWSDASKNVVNRLCSAQTVDCILTKTAGKFGQIGLYRQSWSRKIDLSAASGMNNVKFAHSNGFYAVMNPESSEGDIVAVVKAAIQAVDSTLAASGAEN